MAQKKGTNARDFVKANREKIGEITKEQQDKLFRVVYKEILDDVERICKKRGVIEKYHPIKNISPSEAWQRIPKKIKEILVDLRYRGDYTSKSREHIQRLVYEGNIQGFGRVLSNRSFWPNVPERRFKARVNYYESN